MKRLLKRIDVRYTVGRIVHILRKEVYGSRYWSGILRLDRSDKLGFRHICAYKAMRILSISREYIFSHLSKEDNRLQYTFKQNCC